MAIFTQSVILTAAEISNKIIYAAEVSFQESVAGISIRAEGRKREGTIRANQTEYG
jgi:hypothetical protein